MTSHLHKFILMSLVTFSTVTATAVVRPTVIEFAMLYDVDSGAGRYVAAEQLSGLRTAVYATQAELLPDVEVRFRLEPSPSRSLPEATRRAAVDAIVQSGSYFGYVMPDWTVSEMVVNATRGVGVPVIAPHGVGDFAFAAQNAHVVNFREGAFRETLTMLDHAMHASEVRAVRFVLFLRAMPGWGDVVASVTRHLAQIGLEAPAYFVWGLEETFNATEAVGRWVGLSADFSRRPTAALLFVYAEDASALISAASREPRLDFSTTAFYASSLEIPDVALALSWNATATVGTSADARAVFKGLYLVDSLSDFHDRTNALADYYWRSRERYFSANSSNMSEVAGQAYDAKLSRTSFAAFMVGYTLMKVLSTTVNVTSATFLSRLYDAGQVYLNQTSMGPFHKFCVNPSDTLCFCNSAVHHAEVLSINETSGEMAQNEAYEQIQQHEAALSPGTCPDAFVFNARFPLGLYVLPPRLLVLPVDPTKGAIVAGFELETAFVQRSNPLDVGYFGAVVLPFFWLQYTNYSQMFQHIATRYLPMLLVSVDYDPVLYKIPMFTLRLGLDPELTSPPLAAPAPLSDYVLEWSPYLEEYAHATSAYLGSLYGSVRPRVWALGDSAAMLSLAVKSLHTYQFALDRTEVIRVDDAGATDALIALWLSEAGATPDLAVRMSGATLRPLVVVIATDDSTLGKLLLVRFAAAAAAGAAHVERLQFAFTWTVGTAFEVLQTVRNGAHPLPARASVLFASYLPPFWASYTTINIHMRGLLGTSNPALTENPYTINGALVAAFMHRVSSYLKVGETSSSRLVEVLYNVSSFSALGVDLGPFSNERCSADVIASGTVRRTCQCYRAFRRFWVFDLQDWASGQSSASTQGFSWQPRGCGVEYEPLVVAVASEGLSTAALAGISVGGGAGLLVVLGVAIACASGGKGRDVRRAPKNADEPCAIVFTDIQSSTSLWARAPAEMSDSVEQHHVLIRAALDKHGGYEVKTIGDSFMCAFRDARDAFLFSLAVQTAMGTATWPAAIDDVYEQLAEEAAIESGGDVVKHDRYGLRVRVGAHWGLCSVQYDKVAVGYDYYGTVVNTAARVEGVGHGGQVLLSADLWREVEELSLTDGRLLSDVDVVPLGPQPLRGLDAPMPLYQVLPAAYASRRFKALRLDVQDHDDTTATPTEDTERTSASGTAHSSQGGESRLQRELQKKPHLVGPATMSLQFLEALLSTSTATWREEVLHHVCKRWRVPYEKPTTSQQAKSCEPAASLGQRKDVISLVVKAVVAAEAAIQLHQKGMHDEAPHPAEGATISACNSRRGSETATTNWILSRHNSLKKPPSLIFSNNNVSGMEVTDI